MRLPSFSVYQTLLETLAKPLLLESEVQSPKSHSTTFTRILLVLFVPQYSALMRRKKFEKVLCLNRTTYTLLALIFSL